MDLGKLERQGLIEKVSKDQKLAGELVKSAKNDLQASEDNLRINHPDWALAISYHAMLSAGMALMAAKGFRASGDSHHLSVVKFCAEVFPAESAQLVSSFNKYRVRRNDIIYGEAKDSVGEDEALRVIARAKEFVKKVEEMLAG